MTAAEATRLAQSDPVPNLTFQWGEHVADARRKTESLAASLRALDKVRDVLADHEMTVDVDLGPIGNAAAAARRDLERQKDTPTFTMPTV